MKNILSDCLLPLLLSLFLWGIPSGRVPAQSTDRGEVPAAVVEILSFPPQDEAPEVPLEPGPDPFRLETSSDVPVAGESKEANESPPFPIVHRRALGALLSQEGIILTDFGGLEPDWKLEVRDLDGTRYPATLMAADPQSRLATVKLEDMPVDPLRVEPIASLFSENPDEPVEMRCFAFASAGSLGWKPLDCKLGSRNRMCTDDHTGVWFPVRELASPTACQGSPLLVPASGKMIGLLLGAIPEGGLPPDGAVACGITPFFERAWKHLSRGRAVPYGLLGVVLENPEEKAPDTAIDEEASPTPTSRGVLVQRVLRGSPAESAGLYAGDRLVALDGTPVDDTYSLSRLLETYDPNTPIEVTYSRLGKRQITQLRPMKAPPADGVVGASGSMLWRGFRVDAVSACIPHSEWMEHGIRWFDDGVIVTDVIEHSLADRAGLAEGMLLSHLQGRPTTSIEQFESITGRLSGPVTATIVRKATAGATESRLEIPEAAENEIQDASEKTLPDR